MDGFQPKKSDCLKKGDKEMARMKRISYYDRARFDNDVAYRYFLGRAQLMYTSMRKWENMGEYFSQEFAENCLFFDGWVSVWYDEIIGSYLCGKVIPKGKYDIYGNITAWSVQTINGMRVELTPDKGVIIYDNPSRNVIGSSISRPIPPVMMISHIVNEMCDLHKSMRVNINSLGCPMIISGTQQQQMTLQNKIKYYDAGTPYIFVDSDPMQAKDGDIKALRTGATNNIQSFSTEIDKCWSEIFDVLGIQNVGVNKAERLLVDEVNANNQQVSLVAQSKINSRNSGLEHLNKIFKTECRVVGVDAVATSQRAVHSEKGVDNQTENDYSEDMEGEDNG